MRLQTIYRAVAQWRKEGRSHPGDRRRRKMMIATGWSQEGLGRGHVPCAHRDPAALPESMPRISKPWSPAISPKIGIMVGRSRRFDPSLWPAASWAPRADPSGSNHCPSPSRLTIVRGPPRETEVTCHHGSLNSMLLSSPLKRVSRVKSQVHEIPCGSIAIGARKLHLCTSKLVWLNGVIRIPCALYSHLAGPSGMHPNPSACVSQAPVLFFRGILRCKPHAHSSVHCRQASETRHAAAHRSEADKHCNWVFAAGAGRCRCASSA